MSKRKQSVLEVDTLSVSAGGTVRVADVSLSVTSESVTVLMGPNGSGKSTLVNALMGHPHYECTKGAIRLDGADITTLPPHERAERGLFLSLQHVPRVGGVTLATFLHKVHVATTGDDTDVLSYYLVLRELAHVLDIPDDLLDRPLTANLSGGEKKLSEVLQLAAIKPQIAMLDEIDSGVDVDAMKKVFAALNRLKDDGVGVLLISHHPSLLDHLAPDAVHVLANGRLMKSGDRTLAEDVLQNGFCKTIDCPLEPNCAGKSA